MSLDELMVPSGFQLFVNEPEVSLFLSFSPHFSLAFSSGTLLLYKHHSF